MTIDSWAVIVPQEDAESVRRVEKIAREEGLTQVRVPHMLYMEFNKIVEPPEPIVWWLGKPLPFEVQAKQVPITLFNSSTNTFKDWSVTWVMNVIGRKTVFLPEDWGLQVSTNLWVRPMDCEPL